MIDGVGTPGGSGRFRALRAETVVQKNFGEGGTNVSPGHFPGITQPPSQRYSRSYS
jgi:hypothetical protein